MVYCCVVWVYDEYVGFYYVLWSCDVELEVLIDVRVIVDVVVFGEMGGCGI